LSTLPSLAPLITSIEGSPLPAKPRSLAIPQGQAINLDWSFLDSQGNPIDITAWQQEGAQVQVTTYEALSPNNSQTFPGTIITPSTGSCQFPLVPNGIVQQGVYRAEFAILLSTSLFWTNWIYLVVEPNVTGALLTNSNSTPGVGIPTISEIRLYLRDADPAGNLWVGYEEWDDAEIASCLVRTVREFNETPPHLTQVFTTSNFPYRHNWLLGTAGYLIKMAADWYRRVHLPYQAGGVSIDDKNKFAQYDERGQELIERWRDWVYRKKIQINMQTGYAVVDSPYMYYDWYTSDGLGFPEPGIWW
jgi:hypothetical protein